MNKIVLVAAGSSGLGALTARALARAGHTVYAGFPRTTGPGTWAAQEADAYAREYSVDLRAVELDIADQRSVLTAVGNVIAEAGRIDVVVHSAGESALGPTEAFTPYQLAQVYDTVVLSTQRVNRAVLPRMRERGEGLLVWVGSSIAISGTPPYPAPYVAAKAAMDQLATGYALELARFGIETSVVIPDPTAAQSPHFTHVMGPDDTTTAKAYEELLHGSPADEVGDEPTERTPSHAALEEVARAIVTLVDATGQNRPSRVVLGPSGGPRT